MRKQQPSDGQPYGNYDPLDPQSAYYRPVQQQMEETQEEPFPEFIPAEPAQRKRRKSSTVNRSTIRSGGKKRYPVLYLLGSAAALALVYLVLHSSLFQIRNIRIEGNRIRSASQVVAAAGLTEQVNYFSVNRGDIEKALQSDRYLQLTGFEKRFPSYLLLTVRERALCANVQFNGIWYIIDEEGFVLEKMSGAQPRNTLPVISGFLIRDARIGSNLIPGREEYLASYRLIMAELLSQGFVNEIREINVSNSAHVLLTTRDGFTVDFGWADQYPMVKTAILRGVLAKLSELGKTGGTIDITDIHQAVYSP